MYTFESRVRYSEVTKDQTMDLYAILNYFQDCSNFQSADLGVGVAYLTKQCRAWLLSAWQVELVQSPGLFDRITVGTWPYGFKGMYGYRNFILYNESQGHEVAAYANSIWFLVDTQSGRPLRITPEDAAPYTLEPAYPMEYAPRKITLPDEISRVRKADAAEITDESIPAPKNEATPKGNFQAAPCPPVTVTKLFLDTNNHVNNAQYVRIAQACLPEGFCIRSMRAEYRRAALFGDVLHPVLLGGSHPGQRYVSLNDAQGVPYAVVEFTAKAPM